MNRINDYQQPGKQRRSDNRIVLGIIGIALGAAALLISLLRGRRRTE